MRLFGSPFVSGGSSTAEIDNRLIADKRSLAESLLEMDDGGIAGEIAQLNNEELAEIVKLGDEILVEGDAS